MAGLVYRVVVDMHGGNMSELDVKEFIERELEDIEIVKIRGNIVVLRWVLDEYGGPHDIDNTLRYALDNGNLGVYTYTKCAQ